MIILGCNSQWREYSIDSLNGLHIFCLKSYVSEKKNNRQKHKMASVVEVMEAMMWNESQKVFVYFQRR